MVEPSTVEWLVTSLAVVAVVAVGAYVVVGAALDGAATRACRVAALGLAALAVAAMLAGAVLAVAGAKAGGIDLAAEDPGRPDGPFAGFLFDDDPDATQAAGTHAPLVLGPLALVLGVLAHAVADPARTPGLRAVAGATLSAVLAGGLLVALGDTAALASRSASALSAVAAGALGALVLDEWRLRRGDQHDDAPRRRSRSQASA